MTALAAKGAWPGLEWAVAGRPIPGETQSGDRHVTVAFAGGALFGLIDGLGHGPEAALAARTAAAVLSQTPAQPVARLITDCHEAMRGTRGAVMSLASLDFARGVLSWGGVGNVEGVLQRADPSAAPGRERILLRSGVVGYQLPPLRVNELALAPGDILVFVSDGLRHQALEERLADGPLDQQAERLMEFYAKDSDDAHVLLARFLGGRA